MSEDLPSTNRVSLGRIGLLTGCSLLQMALQFVLLMLIARWFGTDAHVDAFNAAIALAIAFSTILATPLPFVLVPEMVRSFQDGRERDAWGLAWWVFTTFLVVSSAIAYSLVQWPDVSARIVFAGFNAETYTYVNWYLAELAWLVPLNGAIGLLQAMHHARQRFLLPALAGVFGVVVPVVWVLAVENADLVEVSLGIIAGSLVACVMLVLPIAGPLFAGVRASWDSFAAYRRFLWLVSPLMVAGIYSRIDPLIDRVIASYLPEGSVAELGYSQRILTALATLVSSGLSIAIFPSLAASASQAMRDEHIKLLATAWRYLAYLIIPGVVAVLLFGHVIVRDFFERDAFTAEATRDVAALLRLSMGMLVAGCFAEIATKSLYSRGKTRAPAVIAIVGFTVGIFLKWQLAQWMGVRGVALATSIYYLGNMTAFMLLLIGHFGWGIFDGFGRSTAQAALGTIAASLVGFVCVSLLDQGSSIVGGLLGAVIYIVLLRLQGAQLQQKAPADPSPSSPS